MVKVTQALLIAALVAGPALALGEELASRDLNPAKAEADLTARDVETLVERARGGRMTAGKRRGGGRRRGGGGGGRRRGGRGRKALKDAARAAGGAALEAGAGAAAEALAARQILASVEPEFEAREVEELLERSPIFRKVFRGIRRVGGALLGRDFEDVQELDARDLVELDVRAPIFGKIFRGAKRVVGGLFGRDVEEASALTAREVEELFEREPIFGKIFRGAKRVVGGLFGREIDIHEFAQMAERDFDELHDITARGFEDEEALSAREILATVEPDFEAREVTELLERSPIFRKVFRGIKRVGGALLGRDIEDLDDISTRDLVELDVRAPIFGKIFRGAKRVVGGLFGRDLEEGELTAREVEELYEREPIFGKIFRGAKRVVGGLFGREIDIHEFAQLAERGFDELEDLTTREIADEIYERGYDDDESIFSRSVDSFDDLDAREPFFWLAAKALKKVVGRKRSLEDLQDYLEARYFDDEDALEARAIATPTRLRRPAGWRGVRPSFLSTRPRLSSRSVWEDLDELD